MRNLYLLPTQLFQLAEQKFVRFGENDAFRFFLRFERTLMKVIHHIGRHEPSVIGRPSCTLLSTQRCESQITTS